MNFTDNIIDPTTGTLRARAEFANPEAELPRQFVRVFMKGAIQKNAILIPQRAVLSTAQGTIVFIVNEQARQNLAQSKWVKKSSAISWCYLA